MGDPISCPISRPDPSFNVVRFEYNPFGSTEEAFLDE
jgi:hypothetical protein